MTVRLRRSPSIKPVSGYEFRVSSYTDSNSRPETPNSKPVIRNCGREVRRLIVDQADDGSSPFSSAMRQ